MILNKVSIKNFRQYRDVELEFSKDPDKNFTIIKGNNGTGKTTLLNALSWCLYQEEIHQYSDKAMPICNNKSANLANIGDEIVVSVALEFDDDGKFLEFSRSLKYKKTEDDLKRDIFGSEFKITYDQNGERRSEIGNILIRDRKIPQQVEDYFFFDGARLGEYFQATSNRKIKSAVFELSQLNLLSSVGSNLPKIINNYTTKQKQINPQIGQANKKIQNLNKQIDKDKEDILSLHEQIENTDDELEKIRQEQSKYNSKQIEKDIKRDKILNKEITNITRRTNEFKNKRKSLILNNLPYIYSYHTFKNFLTIGSSSDENKNRHADIKLSFLKSLLDEGICICGADLTKDDAHRKAIEELIENTNPITDKSEEIASILVKVEGILDGFDGFIERIEELNNNISELNQDFDSKTEERNVIGANLASNPVEEIRKLEKDYKNLENQKTEAVKTIERKKIDIEKNSDKLSYWRQQRSNEDNLATEVQEYQDKIDFCSEAEKVAKSAVNVLTTDMKNKIQELTKEQFLKIQWKENEFQDIRITKDYDVFIKNKLGQEERPGDLSDGEKLCLGLCFMSAIHNISGFDLPIIMDTPLGNLDTDMRHNIAEFLPNFVGNKQTVLLVTGTEYTEDFSDTLHPSVGKEYVIDWSNSDEGKESKVVSVNG